MALEMTSHGYKFILERPEGGMNRQRLYKLIFTGKQPRLNELQKILEDLDYLYQTNIRLEDNTVFYSGFTD